MQWVVDALPEPKKVATSLEDNEIIDYCCKNNIPFSAGPLDDVLERFYLASTVTSEIDWILRVCCDCPMLTREIVERFLLLELDRQPYTIYTNRPWDPDGYDMELFSVEALKKAHEHATESYDREHVTPWLCRHFNVRRLSVFGREPQPENPQDKVSVDILDDYEKVKKLMEEK